MAKASSDTAGLRRKIEQAQREKRWKDAFDLARNLVQQNNSEESRTVLRSSALGFGRSLAERGRTRDLASELPRLVALFPGDASWAAMVAELAVSSGLIKEGLQLFPPEDAAGIDRLRGTMADGAVKLGATGFKNLPAEMHADHLHIIKAFDLVERGKDDEARTELQGVGLRSPFAEWRLFLRGLQAYYANDDQRASEAWARLAADRLPFRLAAPLRLGIDPAFRDAQTPQTRTGLAAQAQKLSDAASLTGTLARLHQGILKQRSLSREFSDLQQHRAALDALPADLRERLSRSIYWALMSAPDDERRRYLRSFQPPREDPKLQRLEALALERENDPYAAQKAWLAYEKEIATNQTLWGDDSERVRALLWLHAGKLAAIQPEDLDEDPDFSFGIFGGGGRPKKRERPRPSQTAEVCFQHARQLGSDLVEAYIIPIHQLRDQDQVEQARPLADDLRQRFPDDLDAQMTAAMVYADLEAIPEALACAEQAAHINPLDARVRDIRRTYAFSLVLLHLRANHGDEARSALLRARDLADSEVDRQTANLLEATIAWKAGDTGPIEQQRQKMEATLPKIAVVYTLVVQANAAGVDRKRRDPIDKEFKTLLDGDLTLEAAMALGRMVADQGRFSDAPYHGYKTHRDKTIKKLAKAFDRTKVTPRQLLDLGHLYIDLKAKRPLTQLTANVPRSVPQAITFYLRYLKDVQSGRSTFFGGPPVHYLGYASSHLKEITNTEDREYLKRLIDAEKKRLNIEDLSDPHGLLRHMFGSAPGDLDDDIDDDEENSR